MITTLMSISKSGRELTIGIQDRSANMKPVSQLLSNSYIILLPKNQERDQRIIVIIVSIFKV